MKLTKAQKLTLDTAKQKIKTLMLKWKEGDVNSFDNTIEALKSLKVATQEISQFQTPYIDKELKHINKINNAGINIFTIKSSKKKVLKYHNEAMQGISRVYDTELSKFGLEIFKNTNILAMTLLPTAPSHLPRTSPTFFQQADETHNGIEYKIYFSDKSSIHFYSLDNSDQLAKARREFDQKILDITAQKNQVTISPSV